MSQCPGCGEHTGPMTVRELIGLLMENAPDLDARISIYSEEGELSLAYDVIDVIDIEDDESPTVLLAAAFPRAWRTETGEDVEGVVLVGNTNEEEES